MREKNEDRFNGKNEVSGGKTGIELILSARWVEIEMFRCGLTESNVKAGACYAGLELGS